jgi:membrane fusion protein (multidrug efflux system)
MDAVQEPNDVSQRAPTPNASAAANRPFWRRRRAILLAIVLSGGASFIAGHYLAFNLTHEATDDAFIDGHVVAIAPKVAGQVEQVFVTENQAVKRGDPLVQLDRRDFEVEKRQKEAALAAAKANVQLLAATFDMLQAQVEAAEATARQSEAQAVAAAATARRAQLDFQRARELLEKTIISQSDFDAAKAAADEADAKLKAAQEQAASDRARIAQTTGQLTAARKAWERAQAQEHQSDVDLQAAELNLSYAQVTAPQDGQVTKKSVEPGDYLQVGQRIMAIVAKPIWVTANFKETQLTRLRVGQPARISIDSLGGRTFRGHVESIQAGSGARFSLLPPENAVGNYVKVVQRVPVRITFDEPVESTHVLGPGMSVVPEVRVTKWGVSDAMVALAAGALAMLGGVGWWRLANRKAKPTGDEAHGRNSRR